MIDHIRKIVWRQQNGKSGYCYHVYYTGNGYRKRGRHRVFIASDNLPMTVVRFLLDSNCETTYTETGKFEDYTM